MPLLTLFTAPKPFVDPHIAMIQRNTLRNWLALGEEVEIVVIGDEPGIAEVCQELGIRHLPDVRCNEKGTPLISSIFDLARAVNDSPFLAYSNADILFLPDFVDAVHSISADKKRFLVVGQRYDLDVTESLDFSGDWPEALRDQVTAYGRLHGQTGSDYFIYPRACFKQIPDFAVGRAGWDNWMLFHTRWQNWPLVDGTRAVTVIHQNHDYSHLPGGVRHYFQPETAVNLALAGGRRTIFTLGDVTHHLIGNRLSRKPFNWKSFWHEVEIFPLVRLHSFTLGNLGFAIFHPYKAYQELKQWLVSKRGKK
ncbi:MAG TPA: hypothetical protein DF984_03385 [Anaerolineaceae bacterium]|nr:hypothetical protein [Anaerolineaceae bacterium]